MRKTSGGLGRYSLRCYHPGDETAIVTLLNAAYREYGGYVPRDEAYWSWCVLRRPGMDPENVLLLVGADDRPVAYGALSAAGSVLELAVTPEAPSEQRRRLAASLLEALEDRGRVLGLDAIRAPLPLTDGPIREAAEAAGYRMEPMESLLLVVVDVVALLDAILRERASRLQGLGGRAVLLEMEPGQARFLSHDRVLIRSGSGVNVEPVPRTEKYSDAVHVGIDLVTLTNVIFRGNDPDEVIRSGRVRVRREDEAHARALLGALALSDPWYIPLADGR